MWGRTPDQGTPLHLACAAQAEGIVQLLLAAGASPFLIHPLSTEERSPLDVAAHAGDAKMVRRLEALGLFSGWLLLRKEPGGLIGALTGRAAVSLRWVAVVPRYKATSAGLVCRHQLRLSRGLGDALPQETWDVEGASLAADGSVACIQVRAGGGGAAKTLVFAEAAVGGGQEAQGTAEQLRSKVHQLAAACLNRTPPRVPTVGPRRMEAARAAANATSPSTTTASSFPAAPPYPPASPPPPLPILPPAAPPPRRADPEEEEEDDDLAEAIRRSLLLSAEPAAGAEAPAVHEEAASPEAAVQESPSAPPMDSPRPPPSLGDAEAEAYAARKAASAKKRQEEEDEMLCIICLTNGRTAGLLHGSSMHAVACADCAPLLQGKPCPVCRQTVERIIAVFG